MVGLHLLHRDYFAESIPDGTQSVLQRCHCKYHITVVPINIFASMIYAKVPTHFHGATSALVFFFTANTKSLIPVNQNLVGFSNSGVNPFCPSRFSTFCALYRFVFPFLKFGGFVQFVLIHFYGSSRQRNQNPLKS
jgi:hypothetical protein